MASDDAATPRLCLGCFIRKSSAHRRGRRGTLCDACAAEPEAKLKREFIKVPIYQPTKEVNMTTKSKGKKATKSDKPAKLAATRKAAGANGRDPLGRPGTLSRYIADRIMLGHGNAVIAAAAAKEFPKQKSTEASHVAWGRFNLKRKGVKVPAVKEA